MLKLSSKTRYAVRIMIFLAGQQEAEPVRVNEISKEEKITPDYTEQILGRLRTAGLVNSHRGVRGGFTLAHQPSDISVADIIKATEGEIELTPCSKGSCNSSSNCAARSVWLKANIAIENIFSKTTLKIMAEEAAILAAPETLHFDI